MAFDPAKAAVNAAVGLGDDKYNANLMLAKIGDVNFRLGRTAESRAAYGRMVVKKPEGAAARGAARRHRRHGLQLAPPRPLKGTQPFRDPFKGLRPL
jgi:hypothetical protein